MCSLWCAVQPRKESKGQDDLEQPLLGRGVEAKSQGHSHTVPELLRFSAKDSPLLAVAFTAGLTLLRISVLAD